MDTELRGEAEWCRHTIEMPAVTREAVKGLAPEIGSIVCRHLKGIGCDGALMGFVKPDPVLPEVGGGAVFPVFSVTVQLSYRSGRIPGLQCLKCDLGCMRQSVRELLK